MKLTYRTVTPITPEYADILKQAARTAFPDGVKLVPTDDPWGAQLQLDSNYDTLDSLTQQFQHFASLVPWPGYDTETLYFDIETYSAEHRWAMKPENFFRMGQYAWGIEGEVRITYDYHVMVRLIRAAHGVVGHNIHNFDLGVMFGTESMEPLFMAQARKVFDTFVHANLVNPAPYSFTNRKGHTYFDAAKPEKARMWLSLDNQCYVLNLQGKVEDLKELAKKHGGIDDIPADDPEFVEYGMGDVTALQGLTRALLSMRPLEPYDWREQLIWAIHAQMTRNGLMLDREAAEKRVAEMEAVKAELMATLVSKYGLPSEGKMPWRSSAGKAAIFKLLEAHGITEESRPDWTRTKKGNLSLGGEVMVELTTGTPLEAVGEALAALMGQRALAQQALACVGDDDMVHPDIDALQRSGRDSVTKPSLTVWSSKGEKSIEKSYFIAEPGYKLLSFDYSSADARAVAAMSGDKEFAKRFEPGKNPHDENGKIFFGEKNYLKNRDKLRPTAKIAGLGLGYRIRGNKLAAQLGISAQEAWDFINKYEKAFPDVLAWQKKVTAQGEYGYVLNEWGRRLVVDKNRSFTQAPGLMGQNFTREVRSDGLIELLERDPEAMRWIRFPVHDEVVASVPEDKVEYAKTLIKECLEATHHGIEFVLGVGGPADSWNNAVHD